MYNAMLDHDHILATIIDLIAVLIQFTMLNETMIEYLSMFSWQIKWKIKYA